MPEPSSPLLGRGRTADVYALNETQVLRRYRTGRTVAREAETMRRMAELGYPVPIAAGADLLADLHRRLHELPGPVADEPGMRQLHLDLHPENVVLTPAGPVVIDWCNAALGPPDLDVALTAVILGQLAVDDAMPLAEDIGVFLAEFLQRVGGDPGRELHRAVELRRADAMMSATETKRLGAATMIVRRCLDGGAPAQTGGVPISDASAASAPLPRAEAPGAPVPSVPASRTPTARETAKGAQPSDPAER